METTETYFRFGPVCFFSLSSVPPFHPPIYDVQTKPVHICLSFITVFWESSWPQSSLEDQTGEAQTWFLTGIAAFSSPIVSAVSSTFFFSGFLPLSLLNMYFTIPPSNADILSGLPVSKRETFSGNQALAHNA